MKPSKYETGEILEGFRLLFSGNEISCVLIGASMIDKSLEDLLSRYFIKGKTSDKMLSDTGILGTLRNKADCSYALGLVDKKVYQNIIWALEVRNVFGHHHLKCSFANEKILKISNDNPHGLIDSSNADLFYSVLEKAGIDLTEDSENLKEFRCIAFEIVKIVQNKKKEVDAKKNNTE
ncbi:MAG: hypothetical protein OEL83_09625 [Desulforhopalus sp.]|nr:hypothetical protein [Desulforhopalus sp.]